MKLIDKKELNNAAIMTSSSSAFRLGADFAEKKIFPIILKFSEWCADKFTGIDGNWLPLECDIKTEYFTTEQLFEQFLIDKKYEKS